MHFDIAPLEKIIEPQGGTYSRAQCGGVEVHGSQEKIDDMPVRQLGSHNYIKKSAS